MYRNDAGGCRTSGLWNTAAAVILSLLLFILLITSIEAVCYWTPGWFEKEYTKYDVLSQVNGEMSMDSALQVTDEMMAYLRGDRADLVVMTKIDGETVEFFTQREKVHMADVRNLFVGAIRLRWIAIALCVLLLALLLWQNRQAGDASALSRTGQLLGRVFPRTALAALAAAAALTALVATDFNKYFVIFHHIFFDNDFWILYPDRDNLINLLPEGFFMDTAARIVLIFLISIVVLTALAVAASRPPHKS